jgi:glycosyltransferase involved in cell wall biosynthesis
MHCTVLVPAYNREEFISDALESIFLQSYRDYDILVVDDGSTDRTADVVKRKMPGRDMSLITIPHEGCAGATKVGIENARGPVITVLDSDDQLTIDSLQTIVPYFRTMKDLGYAWTNFIRSDGRNGWCCRQPLGRTLYQALTEGWWRACAQRYFRKKTYMKTEGLDTSVLYAVDLQLALLLAETGCETMHFPKITYWRREHPNQISTATLKEQRKCAHKLVRRFKRRREAAEQK